MAKIHHGRYTAEVHDQVVLFLIGMRVNKPWKVGKWLPVFRAMPKMLRALAQDPDKGLLGFRLAWIGGPAVVQYWSSFDALDRFAKSPEDPHLPAWRWYNRAIKASGDVGIWHETYVVPAGQVESIYGNMPRVGLAAATSHVPVTRKGHSAAYRIGHEAPTRLPSLPMSPPAAVKPDLTRGRCHPARTVLPPARRPRVAACT